MLTDDEKKRIEDVCWAIACANISYSDLLYRMLHSHGSLKECPKKIKDGYFAVREAHCVMGEIIKDYNLGSDISLLALSPNEVNPSKSGTARNGRRQGKKSAPPSAGNT